LSLILGISAYYHDSSAALIQDGNIICAVQEERFSRIRHDQSFPEKSIRYILLENNILLNDLEAVVFYEKPLIKFERIIETNLSNVPYGFKNFKNALPLWIKEKLFQKNEIIDILKGLDSTFNSKKLKFSSHHLSHASSAFFPSPFKEAAILTLDGVGEWSTTTVGIGKDNHIKILKEINYPHSLGLLYSAFTYFLGFKVNSGEYKLMGLSPYGKPKYSNLILDKLISVNLDGSFILNQEYFSYSTSDRMINQKFCNLFGIEPKLPDEEFKTIHLDIAASIQDVLNKVVLRIAKNVKKSLQVDYLCLAGGVALNCVTNYQIQKENIFKKVWIQPAAGDAGCSLGCALAYYYLNKSNKRIVKEQDSMNRSLLGPSFNDDYISKCIESFGLPHEKLNYEELINKTARIINEGYCIGFFQGRMEYGPRALGSRSILADPRNLEIQKKVNVNIKFRESFRPFAPAILSEQSREYFDNNQESPYMLSTYSLNQKYRKDFDRSRNSSIRKQLDVIKSNYPAITHVDYSSRLQTVDKYSNKAFYDLLKEFYKITKCPMLLNTSFNVRGEPIVCTPEDSISCFLKTNLDYLVIGNYLVKKDNNFKKIEHPENLTLD